jgi:hypothetical protein
MTFHNGLYYGSTDIPENLAARRERKNPTRWQKRDIPQIPH